MAITLVKLNELKVADLKRELEERELETAGKKGELQQRLRIAVLKDGADPDSPMFEAPCDIGKLFEENTKTVKVELHQNSKILESKLQKLDEQLQESYKSLETKLEDSCKTFKIDLENVRTEFDKKLEETIKRIHCLEVFKEDSNTNNLELHASYKVHEPTKAVQSVPFVSGHAGLPPYDGKVSWEEYFTLFQTASEVHQWTEVTKASMLSLSLRGDALSVLQSIPPSDRLNYDELIKRLEMRFGHRHMEQVYRSQLRGRFQKQNETLQEFEAEIARLVRSAYPTVPDEICESLSIDKFLDGLRESETQQAIKLARPKTLSEALTQALEFEAVKQSVRSHARVRAVNLEKMDLEYTVEDLVQQVIKALKSKRKDLRCWNCKELGHPMSKCKVVNYPQEQRPAQEN